MKRIPLKTIALIIILIFVRVYISAQSISGVVVDSLNSNSIPYVNIYNLRNGINMSTNYNGSYELGSINCNSHDTLVFSVNGYYEKRIAVLSISDTIKLKRTPFELSEITIRKKHMKRKNGNNRIVINRINKKKCYVQHEPIVGDSSLWIPCRLFDPKAEAIFIPYKEEYKNMYIDKIIAITFCYKVPPVFTKIMLYSCNNEKPDKQLLSKPISVTISKNRQLIAVKLIDFKIRIPKTGVFISMENIKIPDNANVFIHSNNTKNDIKYYTTDYKNIKNIKADSIAAIEYSPFLCRYPVKEQYSYWIKVDSEWIKKSVQEPNFTGVSKKIKYVKPAIQLVLSEIRQKNE